MWRVILGTIGILAVIAVWSWFLFYAGGQLREQKLRKNGAVGYLGGEGVELVKDAHHVFTELLNPVNVITAGSYDMLSDQTTKKVGAWLQAHNKWRSKGS